MPASVVLSDVAWSTPDGRNLFSNISMSLGGERTGLVGRNGVGKSTLLGLIAGELKPRSGTVAVRGRLGVLRQTLAAEPGRTIADLFGASEALALLDRAVAGTADEEELASADWTLDARMRATLTRTGLEADPQTPLCSLSGGQRTRAGLAALIFDAPDLLILDEPTNNLDRNGREAVIQLLADWRGGALVASHDRELLESMDVTIELTALGAARYGGGWSVYRDRKAADLQAARHDLAHAERQVVELAQTAQASAERKARKDGAGRRKASKGGQPRILLGAMKNRAEQTGGEQAKIVERRREQAATAAAQARGRIEVLQPITVALPPTGLAPHKTVLTLDHVTGGYAPDKPIVRDLTLSVIGPERVAIAGPNGSGKTTLVALIAGALAPRSGEVRLAVSHARLDQEAAILDPGASIRDNFLRLNPDAEDNACHAALARFRFRADAALRTVGALSGGERLRAALACALGGPRPPQLLILDEPTNHLDLDAIAAIEAGLSAYDGALLVVSHDEAFLAALAVTRRLEAPFEGRLAA